MSTRILKSPVAWAAAVGFVVPIFWTVQAFLNFNARESKSSDIFWRAVHITCPFWDLNAFGDADLFFLPFINAAFYGLVVFVLLTIKRSFATPKTKG
jgi:hypothetical protein